MTSPNVLSNRILARAEIQVLQYPLGQASLILLLFLRVSYNQQHHSNKMARGLSSYTSKMYRRSKKESSKTSVRRKNSKSKNYRSVPLNLESIQVKVQWQIEETGLNINQILWVMRIQSIE
jgi:hypothetical protein